MFTFKLLSACISHGLSRGSSIRILSSSSNTMDKKRTEHIILTAEKSRDPLVLDAKIVSIKKLSPTVKGYTLQIINGNVTNNSFKAGQWVDFFIHDSEVDMIGGFSMCGPPSRLERYSFLDLAVKFSKWPPAYWLHTKAKDGDLVNVRIGGDFFYPSPFTDSLEGHDVLLIAGGVGVNPLASIFFHIQDLKREKISKCKQVHLIFSAKSNEELLFRDEFDSITDKDTSVEYIMTKEMPDNSRINMKKLQDTLKQFSNPEKTLLCYICGPPKMIQDVDQYLSLCNIPSSHIFYELWW